MRRLVLGLAACLMLATVAGAQTPEQQRTADFLAALQDPDGGFPNRADQTSSLGATSSAIRALRNVHGSVRDVPAATAYVLSCRDAVTGGFAPAPKGKPDTRSTAVALMAVAELRVQDPELVEKALAYLTDNARDFEEMRIAVAGFEAVGRKTAPVFKGWAEKVNADRNADGSFGKGSGRARATGSAAVALLRMGADLGEKPAVLAALKAGQRPEGGWAPEDGPSNLETTYRVMRAFVMLKDRPDLDQVRGFIAGCRKSDGGYAPDPALTSDVSSTYFATTILRWAAELEGGQAVVENAGFARLFDGKTLDGWEGDGALWSARDGMLVGRSPGLNHNDFLATKASYGDFLLKVSFRLIGDDGANSGVQFRSVRVPGHEMSGYQADIGQGWYGKLYDESRRNKVLVDAKEKAVATVRKGGWNHYVIRAQGNHIRLSLNGVESVDYREPDDKIARDGKIAVQIHAGGPFEVQYKDMLIQPLPAPAADDANATAPGFHLRTLRAEGGDRKYTVFVPRGYDGSKAVPAVLFLHGSGEKGEDGITPAQSGLGAILNGHPDDFPAIAVFPQARETWKADSADAKAALAALDDVEKAFKVDANRVVLTGLSMGGMGSWSIGSAHPERFAAVVPVCGFGDPGAVAALKGVPVWTVLGDADVDKIVLGNRAAVAALRAAGGSPKSTEYRGVGHNSWDRAYSDRDLIDWMLSQARKPTP